MKAFMAFFKDFTVVPYKGAIVGALLAALVFLLMALFLGHMARLVSFGATTGALGGCLASRLQRRALGENEDE